MPVYRKFSRNDILFSVVHTRPHTAVAWNNGWRGSAGASGSLSLYSGIRARTNVRAGDFTTSGLSIYPLEQLDTHSIDKVVFISGSYPATGSIRFVRCSDSPAPNFFTSITDTRWYEEHFRPIELLYDFYGGLDGCYFTGSYDSYSALLLNDPNSTGSFFPGSYFVFSGSGADLSIASSSSSFTAEAWVKPLTVSSYKVAIGQPNIWSIGVAAGALYFENDSPGSSLLTGTAGGISGGVWSHIAVVVSGGISASFYINGQNQGSALITPPLTGAIQPIVVGAKVSGSAVSNSLNGFIFETRVWSRALSSTEILNQISGTLYASGSSNGLVHYARFNDGPLGYLQGSGALDYSPLHHHGQVVQYSNQQNVHWQPSDHPTFEFDRNISGTMSDIRLFHVPSLFYGKQIDPGSVRIQDGLYNGRRIVRVFQDDGRGSLYVSGSMTRDISGEEYTGDRRRKVGNVFYSEGLIVFTDPALWDMFDPTSTIWSSGSTTNFADLLSLDFDGQGKLYTKTFNCRMGTAQVNASNNPTFSVIDDMGTSELDDDVRRVVRDDGVTYVTAIGLYNEDRILVAVAKLAQPLRKREKDKMNIRLKMDL